MNNDLEGGDQDFITRNLLVGIAFGLYNLGSLRIACGFDHQISNTGLVWVALISCVIFTTIQVQDMKDQDGDSARGRRSAPLTLGDGPTRWTVAIPVFVWSVICSVFLGVGSVGCAVTSAFGMAIAWRTMRMRNVQADRLTWKLWTAWTAVLYVLPLATHPDAITGAGSGAGSSPLRGLRSFPSGG